MANHPNRAWRARWRVDLSTASATHTPTGIVVTFARAPDDPGAWDGSADNIPPDMDGQTLARLMTEAGDLYTDALKARH